MFTKRFDELTAKDVNIAGGKGASLGEMTQTGIPVPPGFVILCRAFRQFIEEADIKAAIIETLKTAEEDTLTLERASEKIKRLILTAKMPRGIALDILAGFSKLNAKLVAVRSSAAAEDSSTASWAGQLESYLNVTENKLLEKVQRCWASLFSPRAILYRFEKNLGCKEISVAVVVQEMVDSEVSGIAFSVNPVTVDRNHIVIEACFGFGEAIVQGKLTPDNYVIEKKGLHIVSKQVNVQKSARVKTSSGNGWINLPEAKGRLQKLSDREILELARLVVKVERHYGFPVDIEFAIANGEISILQSRPVTTLVNNI